MITCISLPKVLIRAGGFAGLLMLVVLGWSCSRKSGEKQLPKTDTLKSHPCGFINLNAYYFPDHVVAPDSDIVAVVSEILEATGMHLGTENQNFVLGKSTKLNNAVAVCETIVTEPDKFLFIHRYIVYDSLYFQELVKTCSPAAVYVILSHEITHHLNGDSFMDDDALANQRQRELAADSFAGYLCYRLSLSHHFSLADCLKVFEKIAAATDSGSHPNKVLREQKFTEGWNNSLHFMTASCDAVKALDVNPGLAIAELSVHSVQYDSVLKAQSQPVVVDTTKLHNAAAIKSLPAGSEVVKLRGDTATFVKGKGDQLLPLKAKNAVKEEVMSLAPAVKPKQADTAKLIKDKRNIIWAKYPNGVPYIAGYLKTLK
jgi:hypothetical protein